MHPHQYQPQYQHPYGVVPPGPRQSHRLRQQYESEEVGPPSFHAPRGGIAVGYQEQEDVDYYYGQMQQRDFGGPQRPIQRRPPPQQQQQQYFEDYDDFIHPGHQAMGGRQRMGPYSPQPQVPPHYQGQPQQQHDRGLPAHHYGAPPSPQYRNAAFAAFSEQGPSGVPLHSQPHLYRDHQQGMGGHMNPSHGVAAGDYERGFGGYGGHGGGVGPDPGFQGRHAGPSSRRGPEQPVAAGAGGPAESGGSATSRTLFVRNISSNTEDSELIDLFGAYGDIRDMYSACKYRGFVMISFFDERSATCAMEYLQGKSLRRRKMDIHFSIPKENQVDAGVLLLFNVEHSTPNTLISSLFEAFGDIKSIKSLHLQTPQHMNAKMVVRAIEYYDERHAACALKALNGVEMWNRKVKIQYGRVGEAQTSVQRQPSSISQGQHRHGGGAGTQPPLNVEYELSDDLEGQPARGGGGGGGMQQHGGGGRRGGGGNSGESSFQRPKKKSYFSLNLQNIEDGKDKKTTVMVRNIPNKYTQKMLLAEIDEELKGKYDFFYLPIDFKNKCNVGYAFMNLTDPLWILTLYKCFNGRRWSHFNSGKICEITYARIQGKEALMAHFKHSSLNSVSEDMQPVFVRSRSPSHDSPSGSSSDSSDSSPSHSSHSCSGEQPLVTVGST